MRHRFVTFCSIIIAGQCKHILGEKVILSQFRDDLPAKEVNNLVEGCIDLLIVQEDVTRLNSIKKQLWYFPFIPFHPIALLLLNQVKSVDVIIGNNSARRQFSGIYALGFIKRPTLHPQPSLPAQRLRFVFMF